MKKLIPILFILMMITGLVLLIASTSQPNPKRKLDPRLAIGKLSKKPYGHLVAFNSLVQLYPETPIYYQLYSPRYLDSLRRFQTKKAIFIIADQFNPSPDEMRTLVEFASYGNTIFLSTRSISLFVEKTLRVTLSESAFPYDFSLSQKLVPPFFPSADTYSYPGFRYASPVEVWEDSLADVLVTDELNRPTLVRMYLGGGSLFLHTAPLALSNYFLLHKQNISYYEQLISALPRDIDTIYWDEYFSKNLQPPAKQTNWWTVMMRYPSTKAALWLAIAALLLYVLLEMRRRRRPVPVIPRPKNDSLDFVRTIGRLYHERGDHRNLCLKMANYFLEHVRNRYRMGTNRIDDSWITQLHHKSGYPENEIRYLVTFILTLEISNGVSEKELHDFYHQLEKFYKHS